MYSTCSPTSFKAHSRREPIRSIDVDGRHCSIQVAWEPEGTTRHAEILVPDVSGELWADAVQTNELPETWVASVRQSVGALLFVRVDSDLHIPSLDWVTARERLEVGGEDAEGADPYGRSVVRVSPLLGTLPGKGCGSRQATCGCPCSCLGYRGRTPFTTRDPRPTFSTSSRSSPAVWPTFPTVEVKVFGVSVVGGDFRDQAFKDQFLAGQIDDFGFVVTEPSSALTLHRLNDPGALGTGRQSQSMNRTTVHHQLHGYRKGHQLLSASLVLNDQDQDVVNRLSDLSGRPTPRRTLRSLPHGLPLAEPGLLRHGQDIPGS